MTSKEVATETRTPLELLTNMQRLFVDGRLNGLTIMAAAAHAGMAEASRSVEAYKMDKHPKVRAAIQYVLMDGKDVSVTREYVLEGFKDAVRAAKDSTEITNAYKEMGKMMGHYAPEQTININAEATIDDIRHMSDKELMDSGAASLKPEVQDAIEGEFEELIDVCQPLKGEEVGDQSP